MNDVLKICLEMGHKLLKYEVQIHYICFKLLRVRKAMKRNQLYRQILKNCNLYSLRQM